MNDKPKKGIMDNLIEEQVSPSLEGGQQIASIHNVSMKVSVILGTAKMSVGALLGLSRGSVIELDKKIGEPVSVVINDRIVAKGSIVQVGENGLGVTLTEIAQDFVPAS